MHDWQTLLAGMIAVWAAAISVYYLRRQIGQTERHEGDRLRRRFAAARATLPMTLNSLIDYAAAAVRALQEFHTGAQDSKFANELPSIVPPLAAPEMIASLERMIEASDDLDVSVFIAEMLSRQQVLHARLNNICAPWSRSIGLKSNAENYILYSAVLHAQAVSLLSFAREESDTVSRPITWDSVFNSLMILGIQGDLYPEIWKLATLRRDLGHLPE